jgi:hypothetical protein
MAEYRSNIGGLVKLRIPLAALAAPVITACSHVPEQTIDFRAVARPINGIIRAHHYRSTELDSERYRQIENDVVALGNTAGSSEGFRAGFNEIRKNGPFSHVALVRVDETASERYARMDTTLAGNDAVTFAWHARAALLTVNTMSGADTGSKRPTMKSRRTVRKSWSSTSGAIPAARSRWCP